MLLRYKFRFSPPQILLMGFVGLILIGTILLMLPIASTTGASLSFVDALFMSTSATCVTGLTVVDTGNYFSLFGQIVLILLIQIGGLGVMTMTTLFAVISGRRIQLRSRLLTQESLSKLTMGGVVRLVKIIVYTTLGIECLGAVLLSLSLYPDYGFYGIYLGLWHSISAFCNAGFDIMGGQTIFHYHTNAFFCLTICALIILGGIGYSVMMEVYTKRHWHSWSLHTKIVLSTTLLLLIVGTLMCFLTEFTARDLSWSEGLQHLLDSFFLATTARTAGYTLQNIGALHESTLFLVIILMFIGASPGSTAGGVKTTTVAIIYATIKSIIVGDNKVVLFKRRIEYDLIIKALSVFVLASLAIAVVTMSLCLLENLPFMNILFEVTSAFATVGLSTGITESLSNYSKIALIVMMLLGRLGVLTFLMALTLRRHKDTKINFPTEKVSVG